MTTTLRPIAPEQPAADGGRSRSYEVCVNSRPVGGIELATDDRLGPKVGRIVRLGIEEPDRHRGRGTVASLAAEEVLRGWGCTQIMVGIPADATTALGLAAALGYTECGRNMLKQLSEPPTLPEGSEARVMTEAEYPAWHAHERAGFVGDWLERGLTQEQAGAKADADYATFLPDGPATPGALLRVLAHGGTDVGTIWITLRGKEAGDGDAYVLSVEVAEAHRGRGHGRTLMLAAERDSLAAGARTLGLHVFAGNTPALRLYESLGYRPTLHSFYKRLL